MRNYFSNMRNNQNNYNPMDNKIVIKCTSCRNNLRVPLNRGKISVTCPVCRKGFIYNPDSILDTLKQIVLSIISWVGKSRRNMLIFIIATLVVLVGLFFLFSGLAIQR